MEPGHHCSYCQRQEHEFQESLNREQPEPSELMVRLIAEAEEKAKHQPKEINDLPF
jgi:hypothetical protein